MTLLPSTSPSARRHRIFPAALHAVAGLLVVAGLCAPRVWSQQPGSDEVAAEGSGQPLLRLTGLRIAPERPGAQTLCTLTIEMENHGEAPAYSLAFEVEVDGRKLPVYERQVYMVRVPPTGDDGPFELRLFNFWTSDSRNPAPADGELEVVVRLVEAQWLKESVEDDGTEVWEPRGPVPDLPSEVGRTVRLVASSDG